MPHVPLPSRAPNPAPLAVLVAVASAVAACGGVEPDPVPGIVVDDGFHVELVHDGLDGPTQVVVAPDGRLVVAELNGGESDGTGRVIALDADGGRQVLFDRLLTPTGVAVVDDEIWVMEQRTLGRGPIEGGVLTTALGPLPFNGRSETTLTATGRGTLLYGTSGALTGGEPRQGSGVLWEHDPASNISSPLSAGFKNAYAHVYDDHGRLWVTEISDGRFDGEPAPDELVQVEPGIDHGWPGCVGDRRAVTEFGGDPVICGRGPRSQALFAPGATPTSVVVAPWDPGTLLVALWVEGRIVGVPASMPAGDDPHQPTEFLSGDLRPQHLVVDGNRLLVVDFDGGRILAVSRRR